MAEQTSIWKKEIHFGRRRAPATPKPSAAAEEQKPPIWSELRVGRKATPPSPLAPPTEQAVDLPAPPSVALEPAPPEPVETAEPARTTSLFELAPDREGVPPPASAWTAEDRRRETPWPGEVWPAEHDEEPLSAPLEPRSDLEDTLVMGPVQTTSEQAERGWSQPALPVEAEPSPPVEPTATPSAAAPDLPVAPKALETPAVEPVAEAVSAPAPEPDVASKPKQSLLKRELHLTRPRRRKPARAPVSKSAGPSTPKKLVGLRVGSSQLAAACVHNNGSVELVQFARTPLSHGIVSSGEVRDVESLTRALKAFFSEHKLPRRGVRLGIASNRIGVRVLDVPALDDPKLFENAIRFHAQETLPIAVTDAVIDYVVLGEGEGQGLEPTVRVLLVFAHRELVDRHVEACRRAGLKLEGIDFEAFALLRALTVPLPDGDAPQQAVVAVAVGNERTIFAVSDGRICDFTRVLEWGGGSLDIAIARALDLTPSQAEPVKLALALDGDVAPSQLSPVQVEAARVAIRTELQALARELVASLQFYQSRPDSLEIGEILLSGGGAQLSGFAAELERLVGAPVTTGDPFAHVQLGKKVSRPVEPGSLTVAIGLGIDR